MLRHKPKFSYNGLTIILSNGSRFDSQELLSGVAGYFFNEECLRPQYNKYQCDIRLIEDKSPLLPGTKVILLLGERAHRQYTNAVTTLDENRGSPIMVNGVPCISSFLPQDAIDLRDFESKFNEQAGIESEFYGEESEAGEVFESKGRGRTARSNYRFWLKADTKKAIRILENNGVIPDNGLRPRYHIRPPSSELVQILMDNKGEDLFYDMETDFYSIDMRCFAFSFGNQPEDIYVVPTLDTEYLPAYGGAQSDITHAKAHALRNNTVVAHNGSTFDFFVLAYKYGLAVGESVYDTMVSNHRIFPKVEKSLGHCVSYWTYEPYHKNEGVHSYRTRDQAEQLWKYCGKDVYTMYLVKKGQEDFASKDAGLSASIRQANDAIVPYLVTTLTGIHYDDKLRAEWISENDRLQKHYLDMMQTLTGPNVQPLISNKKCCEYFHGAMGYPAVAKTTKGVPSLKADALYRLALKHSNPVINLLLRYREIQKMTGTLNFKPWKV
jgi:hypothetical protein